MTTATAPILHSAPPIDLVRGSYRVRFARTDEEREAVFRLRYQVFNRELGEGLEESELTGMDRDAFDETCDHLMVLHGPEERVVGTYRMQVRETASRGDGFYSATEFDLSRLPSAFLDRAVEVGRVCIAREHRHRQVFLLLWKGLAAYARWHGKRYFFGCSSINTQSPAVARATLARFHEQGHVDLRFFVPALAAYRCDDDGANDSATADIPRLFRTYLRYGGRICSEPALDRAFKTVDFFTVLDFDTLSPEMLACFLEKGG